LGALTYCTITGWPELPGTPGPGGGGIGPLFGATKPPEKKISPKIFNKQLLKLQNFNFFILTLDIDLLKNRSSNYIIYTSIF
jgi:hypothetical protein